MKLKNKILEKAFFKAGFNVTSEITGNLDRVLVKVTNSARGEHFSKLSEKFERSHVAVKHDALMVVAKSYQDEVAPALESLKPCDVYGPFKEPTLVERQMCEQTIEHLYNELMGTPLF